jgi:hypothetical protein
MLGFRVWDSVDKKFINTDSFVMSDCGILARLNGNGGVYCSNRYIPLQSTGCRDTRGQLILEGDVLFIYYHGVNREYKDEYILVENVKDFLMWYGRYIPYIRKISNDGNVYEQPYLLGRLKENDNADEF